jgi:hypothetical protein
MCDEPIPSTQSAPAPPTLSTEKGSFRSGPPAPRARPAPVPTSILDVRHHLEQLLTLHRALPTPAKKLASNGLEGLFTLFLLIP